jgi:integrase
MARLTGKLTDAAIRAAKPPPAGKAKLYDGSHLYVRVGARAKSWCWRYRLRGRDNTVTLGPWPAVSLAEARRLGAELEAKLARGIDPAEQRQAERREHARTAPFEDVAREWLTEVHEPGVRPAVYSRNVSRLERFVFPWLGSRPLDEISAQELREVLMRIVDAGKADTAKRVRILVDQVYRHAIATDRASRNVAAGLSRTLPSTSKKHHPALTDPAEVGGLLRAIHGHAGTFVVASALRLAPLVFVRPGELRWATWEEIDLDGALWTIPSERMKGREGERRDHLVPLSTQA